jgi:hypothetical protein
MATGQQPPALGGPYSPGFGQAYQQPLPPGGRPPVTANPRRLIIVGVIVVGFIIAAVIGHAIAGGSGSGIATGDCVETSPSVTSGWDITKVSCNQQYNLGSSVYQVQSVLNGSGQSCYGDSETTFNDDPANKTYCLLPWLGPNE